MQLVGHTPDVMHAVNAIGEKCKLGELFAEKKLVLVAGTSLSGSAWLNQATGLILGAAAPDLYACNAGDFDEEAARRAEAVIIELHEPDEELAFHAWRTFAIHRDLRCIARSALEMDLVDTGGSVVDFLARYVRDHEFWSARAHLEIAYEQIASNAGEVVRSIASALGVPITFWLEDGIVKKLPPLVTASRSSHDSEVTPADATEQPEGWEKAVAAEFGEWLEEYGYSATPKQHGDSCALSAGTQAPPANEPPVPGGAYRLIDPGPAASHRRVFALFEMADAADSYRAFSYLSNVRRQLAGEARFDITMLGAYRGPRLRGRSVRLRVHRPDRPALHRRGIKRFFRWLLARLRLGAPSYDWFSNIEYRWFVAMKKLMRGERHWTDVALFVRDAGFAVRLVESMFLFMERIPRRIVVVLPCASDLPREKMSRLRSYGVRVLFDATEYGGPSVRFARTGLLRCFDDADETPLRPRKAPMVDWRYELAACHVVDERPETVLFIRPDWVKCGSASTFGRLSHIFRSRGAILIDVALLPFEPRYTAETVNARLVEVETDISPTLHFNFRYGWLAGRMGRVLREFVRWRPRTVAGYMLLFYAQCVTPRAVKRLLRAAHVDYIYLNHYFSFPVAERLRPDLPVLLDTHDIQSINFTAHDYRSFLNRRTSSFSDNFREELKVVRRARMVTMVSLDELALTREKLPDSDVFHYIPVPHAALAQDETPAPRPAGSKLRLLIVASRNPANERSLSWFLRDVWPFVAKAEASLEIVGGIVSYFEGQAFPNTKFLGVVDDLHPCYRDADIVVLPITNGGGIGIKTLEAVQYEKAIVATGHALRGLPAELRSLLPLGVTEQELIDDLRRLMGDRAARDERRAKVREAKRRLAEYKFDARMNARLTEMRNLSPVQRSTAAGPAFLRKPPHALFQKIYTVLYRYCVLDDRSDEIVCSDARIFRTDRDPAYIPEMLAHADLRDEDYTIFRAFDDASETVLDVGANSGSSVGSIWASGARCKVLSFEPLALYRDCLQRIADLRPDQYDYRMLGLGSSAVMVRFITPVVNDVALTSLASVNPALDLKGLAHEICGHIEKRGGGGAPHDSAVRLFESESRIDCLDDVLREDTFRVPTERIAAIKIHCDGFQRQVVEGALETIKRHRPLLMLEGCKRLFGLAEMLVPMGYFYAERSKNRLVPASGAARPVNGFFVHVASISRLLSSGIIEMPPVRSQSGRQ